MDGTKSVDESGNNGLMPTSQMAYSAQGFPKLKITFGSEIT